MLNYEKLLKISELNLVGKTYDMDKYILKITAFIEAIPTYEAKLRETFKAEEYDSFSTVLSIMKESLSKIHADSLIQSCDKLLHEVKVSKPEIVEAYLDYLLTAISSLSIDIQMAEYSETDKPQEHDNAQPEACLNDAKIAKSILAVDDSPLMINWIKSALTDSDYMFTGLVSGEAALRYLENHSPNLFILDIEMPEMDGYELARQIRENGQIAPIIFLTGNASKDYVFKALQSGAADFIVKPINIESMLDKIHKYIV